MVIAARIFIIRMRVTTTEPPLPPCDVGRIDPQRLYAARYGGLPGACEPLKWQGETILEMGRLGWPCPCYLGRGDADEQSGPTRQQFA